MIFLSISDLPMKSKINSIYHRWTVRTEGYSNHLIPKFSYGIKLAKDTSEVA